MEKLIQIEEVYNQQFDSKDYEKYDGYKIKTDKQDIYFVIENDQHCCENAGFLTTNDNLQEFMGADLISIDIVNKDLVINQLAKKLPVDDFDAGDIIFVNIKTSVETLQMAAYNAQNGYYGHNVRVISNQLNYSENI